MIPEIRRALKPIYEELEDHPSVLDQLPVPGMGGVNSFFFTHQGRETTDNQMSKINHEEAELVVELFGYLGKLFHAHIFYCTLISLSPQWNDFGENHRSDLLQRTAEINPEKAARAPAPAGGKF